MVEGLYFDEKLSTKTDLKQVAEIKYGRLIPVLPAKVHSIT